MPEPYEGWNMKLSHPLHRPLEDAGEAGVSHIATATDDG